MHELSIANSILEAVQAEAARRGGVCVRSVGVRVGEWSGVVPEALEFGFEALVKDTAWKSLKLQIERCPRRQRCTACGHEFAVDGYEWNCPACNSSQTVPISGDELEIAYLEVEGP
ncbi:MAG: hydrogenase maturation nickel metallochaperone HypA [Acidobacteria bacterium]|nr:hydrogenase maturation nickel metallochaperone HypA [Acidobacteriota bacterium]MBI3663976.1 hydrogenase maturation nickel metallochaperone HypA [Acidobacteriota bacterium]